MYRDCQGARSTVPCVCETWSVESQFHSRLDLYLLRSIVFFNGRSLLNKSSSPLTTPFSRILRPLCVEYVLSTDITRHSRCNVSCAFIVKLSISRVIASQSSSPLTAPFSRRLCPLCVEYVLSSDVTRLSRCKVSRALCLWNSISRVKASQSSWSLPEDNT